MIKTQNLPPKQLQSLVRELKSKLFCHINSDMHSLKIILSKFNNKDPSVYHNLYLLLDADLEE